MLNGWVTGSVPSAVIVRKEGAPASRAILFSPHMPYAYVFVVSTESVNAGTDSVPLTSNFTECAMLFAVIVDVRHASWKSIV